jgi:hypothetical protein
MTSHFISPISAASDLPQAHVGKAGYGVSLTDLGRFEHAMHTQNMRLEVQPVQPVSPTLQAIAKPLESVDNTAVSLSHEIEKISSAHGGVSAGDQIKITGHIQGFVLQVTTMTSIGAGAKDGIKQLFNQQG